MRETDKVYRANFGSPLEGGRCAYVVFSGKENEKALSEFEDRVENGTAILMIEGGPTGDEMLIRKPVDILWKGPYAAWGGGKDIAAFVSFRIVTHAPEDE